MLTHPSAAFVFLVSVCAVAFCQSGSAETPLEKFKSAEQSKGCESIPYDSLRRKCTDTTVDIGEYCKEGKRSCKEVKRARSDPATKDDPQATKELAEGNRRELELRRGWNEKCRDGRALIRDIFSDAVTQGKNESDSEIKPLAQKLVPYWEQGQKDHQQARDDAQAAADLCRDRLNSRDF